MNQTISFAVVGCGHIGRRHIGLIHSMQGATLVAICDTNLDMSVLAAQFDVPFFSSIASLLESGLSIEVLTIATPNGFHAAHAVMGLNAGKHVIIEKPMALSVLECIDIQKAATKNQKQVFCVMQNRYSPTAQWLKSVITQDLLGEIYMIQVNCFWNRDERYYTSDSWHGKKGLDGGPLFTQFSHFMDIIYWLFGEINEINARFFNFNHAHNTDYEDSGIIRFMFKDKRTSGSFHYSTSIWDKNMESSIAIIAEKGALKVGGQYMNTVEYAHIQDYILPEIPPTALPNDYGGYKGSAANHIHIFENVLEVLNHKKEVAIPLEDGLQVVKIIEEIYSHKSI